MFLRAVGNHRSTKRSHIAQVLILYLVLFLVLKVVHLFFSLRIRQFSFYSDLEIYFLFFSVVLTVTLNCTQSESVEMTNKMQPYNGIYYFKVF